MLLIAATFAASKVFHKLADEALQSAWNSTKKRLQAFLKHEPTAESLTPEVVHRALADQTSSMEALEQVFEHSTALRRASAQQVIIKGARILWIDDHPENNTWERRMLEAFGASFVTVETTASAIAMLNRERFDVIISDIGRDAEESGLEAFPTIRASAINTPIVFYLGTLFPSIPPGSLGITNDPEQLIHLLLDALGRTRS
jgi:CheY-like chemotaxis protein